MWMLDDRVTNSESTHDLDQANKYLRLKLKQLLFFDYYIICDRCLQ